MRAYSLIGGRTATGATNLGALDINAATTQRPQVYEALFSSTDTAQDFQLRWQAIRRTAAGSIAGTATTARPLVDNNPASALTGCLTNLTANGTMTGPEILMELWVNARNTYRWVALQGGEFWIPQSAGTGLTWCVNHASAAIGVAITAFWRE